MLSQKPIHNFHIPVLGVGFSVDAPVKVGHFGISSVMSIIADSLLEKLRKNYLEKNNDEYIPINDDEPDARARRITAYLNTVDTLVNRNFAELKSSGFGKGSPLHDYFSMLPDDADLKLKYDRMLATQDAIVRKTIENELLAAIRPGSADVNIMTKIDKPNFAKDGTALSGEYNDAHAALRGFANSTLSSGLVLSAGMNPRLYGYMEKFADFRPDAEGRFKKQIIIKVSDYRSAVIQGKFLAKKGLWVSEFRIESGLNCGGHAFATEGLVLGPILEQFKNERHELAQSLFEIYRKGLQKKGHDVPEKCPQQRITVQGGVGTKEEQDYLIENYAVDSVGWGTPFLLVPEVMNVDQSTLDKLCRAKEKDLYLSGISPLGVPFNNLRDNDKDVEKKNRVLDGKPGSPCTKKYLTFNTEYTEKPICTASLRFMKQKIKELGEQISDPVKFEKAFDKTIEKSCICEGLTVSALSLNDIEVKNHSLASSVCPGPNMAYFSEIVSLQEMVDHIYGRIDLIDDASRPHMFVKELRLYINFLKDKIEEAGTEWESSADYFERFRQNLLQGIGYYRKILAADNGFTWKTRQDFLNALNEQELELGGLMAVESLRQSEQSVCI